MNGTTTAGSNGNRARAGKRTKTTQGRKGARQQPLGVQVPRHFTTPGLDPFDMVEWELRSARMSPLLELREEIGPLGRLVLWVAGETGFIHDADFTSPKGDA